MGAKENTMPFSEFELHYDLSCESVSGILDAILGDLSSHKQLHNWDDKLAPTPLKTLTTASRRYLETYNHSNGDILLAQGSVDEIFTKFGNIRRERAMHEAGRHHKHFFFTKVCCT
jgi:hypothetical protein